MNFSRHVPSEEASSRSQLASTQAYYEHTTYLAANLVPRRRVLPTAQHGDGGRFPRLQLHHDSERGSKVLTRGVEEAEGPAPRATMADLMCTGQQT